MEKNIKVAKYRKLAPVSGNNVTNEPSSCQSILRYFESLIPIPCGASASIAIPFCPALLPVLTAILAGGCSYCQQWPMPHDVAYRLRLSACASSSPNYAACRGINELKNLQYLPRASVMREMLVEDRTKAHADHVGYGIDRKTTTAVGILKAVHCGQQ